jgi:hypothetical protein
MAQGLDSTKTPARPSYPAIDGTEDVIVGSESAEKKMDEAAMRGAKRAENRFHDNEQKIPGDTLFTK